MFKKEKCVSGVDLEQMSEGTMSKGTMERESNSSIGDEQRVWSEILWKLDEKFKEKKGFLPQNSKGKTHAEISETFWQMFNVAYNES